MEAPSIHTGLLSKGRDGRFTASELHKLMTTPRLTKELKERMEAGEVFFGDTALSYIAEKAWERLSGTRNQAPIGRAAERGNDMEAVAFELLNLHWKPLTKVYEDDGFLAYKSNAGATPDGYTDQGSAPVDIKVPWVGGNMVLFASQVIDGDAQSLKDFSPAYYWQVQLQILATGGDHGYLVYVDDRWVNTPADVSEYRDLQYTQFQGDGFAFVARRIPLEPDASDTIDRVLIAAEQECVRLMDLFATSM